MVNLRTIPTPLTFLGLSLVFLLTSLPNAFAVPVSPCTPSVMSSIRTNDAASIEKNNTVREPITSCMVEEMKTGGNMEKPTEASDQNMPPTLRTEFVYSDPTEDTGNTIGPKYQEQRDEPEPVEEYGDAYPNNLECLCTMMRGIAEGEYDSHYEPLRDVLVADGDSYTDDYVAEYILRECRDYEIFDELYDEELEMCESFDYIETILNSFYAPDIADLQEHFDELYMQDE